MCYHIVDKKIWLHEQKLEGVFSEPISTTNHFVTEADKAAVKSRLRVP